MHIGAWQEYKLYKILVLRENYKKNGLYQLSQSNQQTTKSETNSVPSVSAKSTISNSEKTTVTEQPRGRPKFSKRGVPNSIKSYSVNRKSLERVPKKHVPRPVDILKDNFDQWAQYEKAKEKATKEFFDDFAPPPIPIKPRNSAKPPLYNKQKKKTSAETHLERIEKMRNLYGIKKNTSPNIKIPAEVLQNAQQEENKKKFESTIPTLPPIITVKKPDSNLLSTNIIKKSEKFNNEYAGKSKENEKSKISICEEIKEEIKPISHVDENEVDNLLEWAQQLPEELSSSTAKK